MPKWIKVVTMVVGLLLIPGNNALANTVTQESINNAWGLCNGWSTRIGERFNGFPACTITSIRLNLSRVGSPSGVASVTVRDMADTLLGTLGSIDVATIGTAAAWYLFGSPVVNPTTQDIRVQIEFSGGSPSSNYVGVASQMNDLYPGGVFTRRYLAQDDIAGHEFVWQHLQYTPTVPPTVPPATPPSAVPPWEPPILPLKADITRFATTNVGARVYNHNHFVVPNVQWTLLPWDASYWDSGDTTGQFLFSPTQPTRVTAPVDGTYLVIVHLVWEVNSVGERAVAIRINGDAGYHDSMWVAHDSRTTIPGDNVAQDLSLVWPLKAGDFVEVAGYQNSGGPLQSVHDHWGAPALTIQRIP